MKPKEFILELFRETDFLYETLDWRKLEKSEDGESLRSALGNLRRACSAYLNGQDVDDAVARFSARSSKRTSMRNWKFGGNSRHRRR